MDSLPDDILIHILSFLPTKQAALTSVLSKRWRTLFAFTHNLEFDDLLVSKNKSYLEILESPRLFRNFLFRIFDLRDGSREGSQVKKLSLTLKDGDNQWNMNHCLRYAMDHSVSELHLCITMKMEFLTKKNFLTIVFTSTTLVKLSLESSLYIDFPPDTSLPSLKVLSLDDIAFGIPGQLSDVLLAACPVLQDLNIHYEYWPIYAVALSSKTIKSLYYSGIPSFTYYQFDLLVKATLDFYDKFTGKNVAKFISGIRNVKILHLTCSAVEVILKWWKDELPMFNNLVDLVFSSNKQGWRVLLPCLLECSPNLKVLVLSGLHRYTTHRRFVGIQIPLENQIEKLSIKQYQGSANELKHIRHILRNMKHLKVVKVYVVATMDEPKKMQLTEDLMKLSSEIKIQVI